MARLTCLRICEPRNSTRLDTLIVVASVPFLAKIAQSACATVSTSSSASSTVRGVGPFTQSPRAAWACTAASTSAWLCPITIGPKEHIRSTYGPTTTEPATEEILTVETARILQRFWRIG